MKADGLPVDIWFEIFLRLPVKSISKFKCVCKVWLSILSDTDFTNNRFKTLETKPWAVFSNDNNTSRSRPMHTQLVSNCSELFGYDGFSFRFIIELYQIVAQYHRLHVLASSNGLVLCSVVNYCTSSTRYFVCNPVTKECVSLPPPPRKSTNGKFFCSVVCETYTSSTIALESTFKVMRTRTDSLDNVIEIFYSDLDEWRTHTVSWHQPRGYKSNVITRNGVVYWLEGCPSKVVVYDLKINNHECDSHQCNVLNVPVARQHRRYRFYSVSPSSECLGVAEDFVFYGSIYENTLTTWILMEEDYSNKDSVWNLRHKIELPDSELSKASFIGFSPMDLDVVILDCGEEIFPYNATTGRSELHRLCVPSSKNSFKIEHGYAPFIVIPTLTTISLKRR